MEREEGEKERKEAGGVTEAEALTNFVCSSFKAPPGDVEHQSAIVFVFVF